MFKKIGDERAFNGILNQIIDNIQNGKLKAGDALPAERTMAETMGVSRPAVREVLRALELLGIIKPVPGGGNYITENLDTWLIGPLTILFKLNNGYLKQNQQFRAALEREAAILAAKKCTPLDAAELYEPPPQQRGQQGKHGIHTSAYGRKPLAGIVHSVFLPHQPDKDTITSHHRTRMGIPILRRRSFRQCTEI